MLAMRLGKLGSRRNSEWSCFGCIHVRTATIILGIWHLSLHLLALVVLALLMRNHNLMEQRDHHEDFQQNDFLPTPLSKVKADEYPYYLPTTQDGRTIYSSDMDSGALVTICTLAITLCMLYGTIKGKAHHLLPFFCLQVFDFAVTALTATGYFCYLRSIHHMVEEHWHNLPSKKLLLSLSPQMLSIVVLSTFLIAMAWKACCISIVWRCYKFLSLKQQNIRSTIHFIAFDATDGQMSDPDYSSILCGQEAAMCGRLAKQTPPPSYQDVMGDQPPPYPATVEILQENMNNQYHLAVAMEGLTEEREGAIGVNENNSVPPPATETNIHVDEIAQEVDKVGTSKVNQSE
ncbi:lysosomal-associated transmembrane protein 4B [Coccinella septempunctata]|uniref:lysosomal-associated transmembrane protein 4B n=1 Tax=Coccinella septempunctata TaxID=41139 RepID=UPI001D06674C|nr:lysosomal-associated transmembrane protein 4B [Coccinella septempunctata]